MARPTAEYPTTTKTARLRLPPRVEALLPARRSRQEPRLHPARGGSRLLDRPRVDRRPVRHAHHRRCGRSWARRRQGRAHVRPGPTLATAPALPAAAAVRITVRSAMDRYLTALAGRSPHAKEAGQRADKHILPALGAHRVDRITKRQIEAWLAGLVKDDDLDAPDARRRSQDSANRILTILRAALNAAFADDANGIATDAAWRRVKPFRDVAAAREDHFEAPQVRTLIAKAATFDRAFAHLLEAGYLTGARMGELAALDVRDFDARDASLTIRKGKTGARTVTLSVEGTTFFKPLTSERPAAAVLLPTRGRRPLGKERTGAAVQARRLARRIACERVVLHAAPQLHFAGDRGRHAAVAARRELWHVAVDDRAELRQSARPDPSRARRGNGAEAAAGEMKRRSGSLPDDDPFVHSLRVR